jgi:hypothetical protein
MRIKRFFESIELTEIEDLVTDFEDRTDFIFEITSYANFINLVGNINKLKIDKITFLKEIITLVERIKTLGYKNINSGNVLSLMPGKCEVQLQFVDELDEELKVPEINSFDEFKNFLQNSIKLIFYEFDSELYLPNNNMSEDLLVSLEINDEDVFRIFHTNTYEDNLDINWSLFNKTDADFLESVLITDDESKSIGFYDDNGVNE